MNETMITRQGVPRLQFEFGQYIVEPERRIAGHVEPGLRIGRSHEFSTVAEHLTGHMKVSREHAELGRRADGTVWIRDIGSTNGTYVNTTRIESGEECTLREGDTILFSAELTARFVYQGD